MKPPEFKAYANYVKEVAANAAGANPKHQQACFFTAKALIMSAAKGSILFRILNVQECFTLQRLKDTDI